ncbi:hypothetical protein FGD24_12495 [Salmonella enterica subsp. enterica serovar Heidelberg]|nr:hypothetical protein FGD24_12495 [Salmonella enterica subsp. enterica serovar Heidelberg]
MLWQQSLLERPRTGPAQKNRSIERFFCGLLKPNLCRSFYISLNGRPDKRERHPAWQILSGFNR